MMAMQPIQNEMFCDQCQEAASGGACTRMSMCGIDPETAALRDLLVYVTGGLAAACTALREAKKEIATAHSRLLLDDLVMSSVNVNFDADAYRRQIALTIEANRELVAQVEDAEKLPEAAKYAAGAEDYERQAKQVGRLTTEDADIRGLRGMITYAMAGIAAFTRSAMDLGVDDDEIHAYVQGSLAKTTDEEIRGGELIATVLESGRYGIRAMKLAERGRVERLGTPQACEVKEEIGDRPGILVLGDSYSDLAQLLAQSEGAGVDIYVGSDLIAAGAYPGIAQYAHFKGLYGGTWWKQKEYCEAFAGPILMTSDEFTTPRNTYRARLFTTGMAGFPGCTHIAAGGDGVTKDFSQVIEMAKVSAPPKATGQGAITTGWGYDAYVGHGAMLAAALKKKDIRKLAVIIGSDGRAKSRSYYSDFARDLPEETVLLSAGSIKYRFADKHTGETFDVPRLLDAGDLTGTYKVAELIMTVQENMSLNDISQVPVYYNVAWYDPKSIIALLSLLYVGVKNIHLGPTQLGFLSGGIRQVFASYFGLKENGEVAAEIETAFGARGSVITADMIVGDIVEDFPELVPAMLDVGLHCLSCGVSQIETLAEACEVHGLDVREIMEILNDELAHPAD